VGGGCINRVKISWANRMWKERAGNFLDFHMETQGFKLLSGNQVGILGGGGQLISGERSIERTKDNIVSEMR